MTYKAMPGPLDRHPLAANPWLQVLQVPSVRVLSLTVALALGVLLLVIWPQGALHVPWAASSAAATRPSALSVSSDPLCKFTYTVPNWEGQDTPVCDTSICKGRERLRLLPAPAAFERRWSAFDEATYLQLFRDNQISGWLQAVQITWVREFTKLQHSLQIYGTVGEIGVHHGKFLMPLVGYAAKSEPTVAMDLFEDQNSNVDGSGKGSTSSLLRNLERVGIPETSMHVVAGNSMFLTAANFTAKGLPAFRLLSVDGGHSFETTLHDMMLANCLLRDGGLMVLDDVNHPTWQGVIEAMVHFTFAQQRLVPILLGYNKAWFATASHAQQYREFIRTNNATFQCRPLHASRHAIGGYEYCYGGPW